MGVAGEGEEEVREVTEVRFHTEIHRDTQSYTE